MNKFDIVRYLQFEKDAEKLGWSEDMICDADVRLPKRATVQSAAYDFFSPYNFIIHPGWDITIPTGIKVQLDPGYFLMLVPRSSLGFKYNICLANTVGIIDADYYNNLGNEGHIMVKLVNRGDNDYCLRAGDAFCQGIILPYAITEDDDTVEKRIGGLGSTSDDDEDFMEKV